ncbi:MAG: hypothetical protein RLZZ272_1073 [Actinomycetota bacterium]|jgi:uncharacterized protein with von Willebrand factor type A (vWA) domain
MPDDPGEALVDRVLALGASLRSAGIGATQAEAVDAVRALPHVELLDRTVLREALAAVLLTAGHQRPTFDDLFDLHLPARPGDPFDPRHADPPGADPSGDDGRDADDPATLAAEVIERLLDGDDVELRRLARRAVASFGRLDGHDGRPTFLAHRALRALDLGGLLEELLRRRGVGSRAMTPLEERLVREEVEERLARLREEIEAEVRRRAVAERGLDASLRRLVRPPLEELDLFLAGRDEQAELARRVRPLARRMAARLAVKRRRGRDGRLDVRRTVRHAMSTGGVPLDPEFRARHPQRPELMVVCDVSGSVAAFARFTLMLAHALHEQFSRVRSFAFIDDLDEVTHLFAGGDLERAVARMHVEASLVWYDGHSDYGRALERFHARFAREVTPRTTVLLLGDARNNYRQPGTWVLEDLVHRARRVHWLNPEPRGQWDTGDSIASRYAAHVTSMTEVRNVRQLVDFVESVA